VQPSQQRVLLVVVLRHPAQDVVEHNDRVVALVEPVTRSVIRPSQGARARVVGESDRATRCEGLDATAAFDRDRREITGIDADLGSLTADPHVHMVTTVMDREAQRAK
jgi:hypothetical protein